LSSDSNERKAVKGVKTVTDYLTGQGWESKDVSRKGGAFKGCDVVAHKGTEQIRVEVKASSSEHGIPDFYSDEFENMKLVADYVYIVRLGEGLNAKRIDILTKEEVDSFSSTHTVVERIRTSGLERALAKGTVGRTIAV